jgi:tRNA threonylcarbamoyladenosine biosynthesis protein TsaE
VDAYRLGDEAELDDLDLDAYVDEAVTVVEWGEGIAEALSPYRLRLHLARTHGSEHLDETRVVTVTPVGARWFGAGLRSTLLARASDRSSAAMTPQRSDHAAAEGHHPAGLRWGGDATTPG